MDKTEKTEKTLCVTVESTDTITVSRDEFRALLVAEINLAFLKQMYMNTRSSYHMDDPLQFVFGKRPPEKKEGEEDGTE